MAASSSRLVAGSPAVGLAFPKGIIGQMHCEIGRIVSIIHGIGVRTCGVFWTGLGCTRSMASSKWCLSGLLHSIMAVSVLNRSGYLRVLLLNSKFPQLKANTFEVMVGGV